MGDVFCRDSHLRNREIVSNNDDPVFELMWVGITKRNLQLRKCCGFILF